VDRGEPTYQTYKKSEPLYRILIPLAVLIIVVGIVTGLVFGGVIQGNQERVGPEVPTTTPATLLIVP
jgi:hypothetical protein